MLVRMTTGTPASTSGPGSWRAVAAGGAVGTAARAGWLWLAPSTPGEWPTTIFLENLLGAFALGLLLGALARGRGPRWLRSPFFTTGALGSFTTFSNLTWDLATLANSAPLLALAYGAASLALGLVVAGSGWWLGHEVGYRGRQAVEP